MSSASVEILDPGVLGALLELIGPDAAVSTLAELIDAWDQSSKAHLEALIEASSADEIRVRVHSLKGATAQLGGLSLVNCCKRIEAAIDGGAAIEADVVRAELERERQVLRESLRSRFGA